MKFFISLLIVSAAIALVVIIVFLIIRKILKNYRAEKKYRKGNSLWDSIEDSLFDPNRVSNAKGRVGENIVREVLGTNVPDIKYVINDIIITDKNGRTHQIDHILIRKDGIYVIETKNYSGKIYGFHNSRVWTQYLGDDTQNKFENPIKQNSSHIYYLKPYANSMKMTSIVCFVNGDISNIKDCEELMDLDDLTQFANQDYNNIYTTEQIKLCYERLKYVKENQEVTLKEHVKNIKEMKRGIENNICPRCGGELVIRRGEYNDFLGCENYPRCKFKKNL